ncbi:bifunctional aspartate kinase/homoserine dehydrogenase II [Rheinheimera sp.]|uniref:bifunctional aspartate kinase/homoserine dehydrogenase II n=1 Tax=Rheinheimera sp. TaxID=1869214 RepID=UPI002733BF9E|nr:bifunctional aspartate kinase/homoserine dehydrogenase II [Rheinheimera sp.]MDP2714847.1 bifunctional aspartate kinase/homoserine dehydrogenase II [Rheinheimera sp.]
MHVQVKAQHSAATQVHKFGGSSLAGAERFAAVADILLQQDRQQALWVVVSAPGDTTDALLAIITAAEDAAARDAALNALQAELTALVQQTLAAEAAAMVTGQLLQWLAAVPAALAKQQPNDVLAIGERLSALLLSELLKQRGFNAAALDARDFLHLKQHQPDWLQSATLLAELTLPDTVHVVTGYIARDEKGRSITLGRNGSDYSATLLGALVNAAEVTIWTDVKAIYSADPRKVKTAVPYQQVSWQQACQLAQLGNPVLHARTLSPLTGTATALRVRSSYQPQHAGCHVVQQGSILQESTQQDVAQQGFITELDNVTLLTLHQDIAVSAAQLALELQQPVIALPQQGDNLCWLLPAVCAEQALDYLAGLNIHAVWDTQRYYALAWLKAEHSAHTEPAEQLLQQHGVLHRYESAQQLIWLLAKPLPAQALEQLHQYLIQPAPLLQLPVQSIVQPELQIVVAGTGNVGAEFLAMLAAQQQRFVAKLKLNLAGVLNSRRAALKDSITITDWQTALAAGDSWDAEQLSAYVQALPAPKVLVDITPSRDFAQLYPALIAAGCDIISANKQGVTLPGAEYRQIKQALVQHQRQWLSNTTCGAGIPVQRTLQELLDAGDRITAISGIFSGTLSWLLCKYDGSKPFSDFVLEAQQAGLTEPDPRDDLSGKDVQRKLLVLARELGIALELDDIELQPLLPAGLEQGSWQQFWPQRAQLDNAIAVLFAKAQAEGKVLRYVASLELAHNKPVAKVALEAVSAEHALAAIAPCDNVFVIQSAWYDSNPLVLKGPGAGKVVTAGGLHADLAQLINQFIGPATTPAPLT